MTHTIHHGNNIDILKTYPDNHFDAIVTDPPYGIEFLAKEWDKNTGAIETWEECFRVLKPGGYLLAFSAARTYHNLATNIEGVGFEIRDQLMWLYASGFPKAQDIGKSIQRRLGVEETKPHKWASKQSDILTDNEITMVMGKNNEVIPTSPEAQQWEGWKTALKPAHEPIVMARKPFKGSTIDNVLTHGVGALNIDATRIETDNIEAFRKERIRTSTREHNTINQKTSVFGSFANKTGEEYTNIPQTDTTDLEQLQGRFPSNVLGEVEGYQKFFYCPKVSRAERHTGFEAPPDPLANYSQGDVKNHPLWDPSIGTNLQRLKHKILEHNKDMGKKTLDHIPTNPSGMYEQDENGKCGERYEARVEKQRTGNNKKQKDPGLVERGIPGDFFSNNISDYGHNKATLGNNHPTVKPVALMRYLIKLVTPQGGSVLDPFTGSGSTGMAAVELGCDFTGCELDEHYVEIANTRINAWKHKTDLSGNKLPEEFFEEQ